MTTNNLDGPVIAVAATPEQAGAIARAANRGGATVSPTTDLGWALAQDPSVLLIAPTGWEGTAVALLSGFETRNAPPPAVLAVSNDEKTRINIGPVLARLPDPPDPDEAAEAITLARARRIIFAQSWPGCLNIRRDQDVERVEELLAKNTGLTLRADRKQTFLVALQERMIANLTPTVRDYESHLHNDLDELSILACRIVIGETHFWRYSGQMNALKSLLLVRSSEIGAGRPVKIWCAGCSTGEEPYSVAMAAMEALGETVPLRIWGTDIHPVSLEAARQGCYSERSLRNLPERLLGQWFSPGSTARCVNDGLREKVEFEQLNLCSSEAKKWARAHGPFDAIFCRNVIIYFTPEKNKEVITLFTESLNTGGGLFLGSSETLFPPPETLGVIHSPGAFYYVKKQPPSPQPQTDSPTWQPQGEKPHIDTGRIESYHKGLEALGREDFDAALETFDRMMAADPNCPMGNTGAAIVLANQGREVEARQKLLAVADRGHEPAETQFMLGLLDERAAMPEQAMARYARALELDPGFFMAHFNRAWIMKRDGRTSDFRTEMRRALSILNTAPKAPAWVTGGLSLEAILALVAEAVEEGAVP